MAVLIIIAIASTVVGIQISKSISEYEYSRATAHLAEKIKVANKLALVNQCDVYLTLIQEKNKISTDIGYYENSLENGKKIDHQSFSNIKFKFKTADGAFVERSLALVFTSTGDYLPRGELYLSSLHKSREFKPVTIDFGDLFLKEHVIR